MEILGILLACKLCIVKSWAIWGRLHGLYDIEILFQSLQSCASLEGCYHQMRPFEISKKSKSYTLLWPVNSEQWVFFTTICSNLSIGQGYGQSKISCCLINILDCFSSKMKSLEKNRTCSQSFDGYTLHPLILKTWTISRTAAFFLKALPMTQFGNILWCWLVFAEKCQCF